MEGRKDDKEKNRMDLIPTSLVREVGAVLTHGASKYGDRNWEKGMNWNRPYGAILRHLTSWWEGEDTDLESGLNHLAHAACEIAFLIEYQTKHTGFDNRPKKGASNAARDTIGRPHFASRDCGVDGPDGHV